MELTAQTLREVEFREKLRGYHPDDVDDFLEEAAVALEELLDRLNRAESRSGPVAVPAPEPPAGRSPFIRTDRADDMTSAQPPAPSPPAPPVAEAAPAAAPVPAVAASAGAGISEQTLQRTLLLAQQTADAAIADAEEAAKRILDEAQAEARRITEEAQARATEVRTHAESRATQALTELEQQRAGLEHEVVALRSWAVQQRDRLRDALTDQVRSLDIWLSTSAPPSAAIGPAAGTPGGAGPALEKPAVAGGEDEPAAVAPGEVEPEDRTAGPESEAQPRSDGGETTPEHEGAAGRPMPFDAAGPPTLGALVDHEAEPGWLDESGQRSAEGSPTEPPGGPANPSGGLFRPR